MLTIVRATSADIEKIVPLFDAYRVFYKQQSDKTVARSFLEERLGKGQSIIFMASLDNEVVGFTQLYTTFSSVSMRPFYILNDLFVLQHYRGKGVGEQLLNKAKECCKTDGYKGVALETAMDNPAQQLYEKLDWKKDTGFFHYFWMNPQEKS